MHYMTLVKIPIYLIRGFVDLHLETFFHLGQHVITVCTYNKTAVT